MARTSRLKTAFYCALALLCFAANSILCRLALLSHSIDPATFTLVRLFSGALLLAVLVAASGRAPAKAGSWISAVILFLYAIPFSLAFIGLGAGTGALILFGSVQATMIIASILAKKHPTPAQWMGLLLAIGGLVYLVAPGLSAPPMERAAMMAVAGIAWGLYSLRGFEGSDPVAATAGNFLRAAPFTLVSSIALLKSAHASPHGVLLAAISGAITSGLGYVFWYAALPGLGAIRGGVVLLTVPLLAAAGGVLFLHETLSQRLTISTAVILSGVALAVALGRKAGK